MELAARPDYHAVMPFKVFDAYGAASRPEATLRASGYIFLSKGLMKRVECEDAVFSQLMYDEDDDTLGIKLFNDLDAPRDGTAKEASVEKSGIAVNLTPLLRYYNLPEPRHVGKQVFTVTFDRNVILIDLKEYRNLSSKPESAHAAAAKSTSGGSDFDDDIPF